MEKLFSFSAFLLVLLTSNLANTQKAVGGNYSNHFWNNMEMNLWTFWLSRNESISDRHSEIFALKLDRVKGIAITENNNIEFLPIKVNLKFPHVIAYSGGKNSIKEIRYENFEGLRELQALNIENNQIRHIPKYTFKDLVELKILFLDGNKIKTLEGAVFQTLTKLQTLQFDANQVSSLPENIFTNQQNLTNFSMSQNKIQKLSDAHFKNNKKLMNIWLDGNEIESLSSTIFDGKNNLGYIDLSNNKCINGVFYQPGFSEMKKKIGNYCK